MIGNAHTIQDRWIYTAGVLPIGFLPAWERARAPEEVEADIPCHVPRLLPHTPNVVCSTCCKVKGGKIIMLEGE